MQLLRDQEGASDILEHLEAELAARDSDPNEVLRREHHTQAANQVTVGNCVLSLRLLSAVDWNAFFEQSSRVEAILREDPSGVYPQQDFATSDRYRRTIEMISRGSDADEIEVARRAIELAGQSQGLKAEREARAARVASRAATSGSTWSTAAVRSSKSAFGYRPGYRERLFRSLLENPESTYFGAIAMVLVALMALAVRAGLGTAAATLVAHPGGRGPALAALRASRRAGQPPADPAPATSRPAQARVQGGHPRRARDLHRDPRDAHTRAPVPPCSPSGSRPTTFPTPTPASVSPCSPTSPTPRTRPCPRMMSSSRKPWNGFAV